MGGVDLAIVGRRGSPELFGLRAGGLHWYEYGSTSPDAVSGLEPWRSPRTFLDLTWSLARPIDVASATLSIRNAMPP